MRWSKQERAEAEALGLSLYDKPPPPPRRGVDDGAGGLRLVRGRARGGVRAWPHVHAPAATAALPCAPCARVRASML